MNARGLIYFNTLFYWSTRATGPTILATVGIAVRRVTGALLSGPLGFLKLFFKLLEFLGQISHLARVTTALFPGLLCGIEGL